MRNEVSELGEKRGRERERQKKRALGSFYLIESEICLRGTVSVGVKKKKEERKKRKAAGNKTNAR